MEQRAPLRLLRALLVTAVVLALAAAGHLAGGGSLPPLVVMIGLAAGVLGPVAWAGGRQLTLGRLMVPLGVAQWGLHEAFLLASAVPACAPVLDSHHSAPLGPGTACPTGSVLEAGHNEPSGQGAAMLVGHVLAVLVTALVITRAEAALWLALEWLRPLLGLVRPAVLPAAARPLRQAAERPVLVRRGVRRDRVRGPPAAGVLRAIHRV
ncbi:hypothetical protein [Kocuria sp. CPCC 205263]|uniref:hypothetical protein n=1 Tax=Kocuria sp. CPCC 205263 TaxID=3073555 RepID=UPI0034D5B6BE